MAKNRKQALPFDKRGGVIAVNRRMLNSPAYLSLTPQQKVLLILLQEQWRNDRPVAYGVREAAAKIPCNANTASKAFKALQSRGFIECVEQSQFNSRTGSKAREWRLTWLPFMDKKPTNEWEEWSNEN